MDFQNVGGWLPQAVFAVFGIGVVYLLLRFKRQNDLAEWFKLLRANAALAAEDSNFRIRELREAEADLLANPLPDEIAPIKRNHEYYVHALPKLLFLMGLGGVILLYLGLFQPAEVESVNWMLVAGSVLLVAVMAIIFATAGMRRHYNYVRILNRFYIMQKAGNDWTGAIETLGSILRFYPGVPELWLEKANMLTKKGMLEDALAALAKSREISPGDMDLAVIEASYRFRKNDIDGAAGVIESLPGMRKVETDPRPDIFAAVLALKRDDENCAKQHAEWAVKLDAGFTGRFLRCDETLADLTSFMKKNGIIDAGHLVEA